MKYFALFDEQGLPSAFYNEEVHGTTIPGDAIAITHQQWLAFVDHSGLRRWQDGHVVPYEPPEPTADEQRKLDFPDLEPDQFWFGLRASGYDNDVREFVASLNDPESPSYNPVEWASASAKLEFAKYFERDHPLVLAAQQAIGITEVELDALWQFAAG